MNSPEVPDGFRRVTEREFFDQLKADPRDIMPRLKDPTYSTWETRGEYVWGWTAPGWANPMEHENIYAIAATEGGKNG